MGKSKSRATPRRSRIEKRKEYDYDSSPLSAHERMIRLIQLFKNADGSIRYDLVPFQLANAPSYRAVSYRWGSPELVHFVTIGNATLRVTSSTYDILRDCCLYPKKPGKTRYLWIDFLCINQQDKAEKDKQIPLMRDIYAGASKVVIYLGDAPDAKRAHEFLARFSLYQEAFFGSTHILPVFETLLPGLTPLRDRPACDAFLRMITNDYWSRAWVIQEIICGKQVFILYGGRYSGWSLVNSTVHTLKGHEYMSDMLLEGLDEARRATARSALECILCISILHSNLESGRMQRPLSTILLHTGYSQASLPQDKVFALLALSSDVGHPDLQPNHELAAEQVYQKVMSHSLRQGTFSLWHIAGLAFRELYGSTISGLPSWVPDFSSSGLFPSLGHLLWPYRSGGMWAEGNIAIENELHVPVPNCLSVKGVVIGRIAVMSALHVQQTHWRRFKLRDTRSRADWCNLAIEESIHYLGERLRPESDFHHEMWEMVEAHCSDPYLLPTGASIPRYEALWRTIVGNKDMSMKTGVISTPPQEIGRRYELFRSVCKALRAGEFVPKMKELQEDKEKWKSLQDVIDRLRKSTCPFVVTDGKHMGAVVAGAQVGDLVCVFPGAEVPYVLRPSKDDVQRPMQLVCPSYIHGFMDGEAIECGKYEERRFHIV